MIYEEGFMIVGHRGLSEKYVENSMGAFVGAKAAGLEAIELDVQLTKDKKIVVFHDFELKRLCGVDGKIWDYTLAELQQFKLLGGNEGIPTLSEVLDRLKEITIFIELKTIDQRSGLVNEGIETVMVNEISKRDSSNLRFISFNPQSLKILKGKNRQVLTGLNVVMETVNYMGDINVKMLRDYSIDFVQPEYEMYLSNRMMEIEKAGIAVIPWTVNDQKTAKLCKEKGAAGIITDIPLQLREKLK